MTRLVVLMFCAGLAAGCGEPVPDTVGDAYEDLSESYCVTMVDCGYVDGTTSACASDFYDLLCEAEGTNCAEPMGAEVTRGEWNDCLSAIETMSCSNVQSGELPRSCYW